MDIFEILLLIIGTIVFAVSFLLPEKKEKIGDKEIAFAKEKIDELVKKEIGQVRNEIEDVVDETITYSMEKTERTLERISNEKIMAVNEYSDTVLDDIHKNHEEVMFLYDMLNQKQHLLKETALDAQKMVKTMEEKSEILKEKETKAEEAVIPEKAMIEEAAAATPTQSKTIKKEPAKKTNEKKAIVATKKAEADNTAETGAAAVSIQFAQGNSDNQNNNEKILELHKAGKSKMVIAKELGLGVGEVKLVIDLFEGM